MSIPTWNGQMVWNVEEAAVAFQGDVQKTEEKPRTYVPA
jgi:hypothetical protein